MPKRSKFESPNQLLLNFEQSREKMKAAVDEFGAAAQAVADSHENPETATMVKEELQDTRESINRLVGVLASQTGMPFHSVWTLVYSKLHQRTGFHAAAASEGKGTHLDAVQKAGKLPALKTAVTKLLKEKRYNKRGGGK